MKDNMEEIKQYAKDNYIPIVRDNTAKKLIEICKSASVKSILEIGTAIGYSGLLMLNNSNANLYTIEKDKDRAFLAKENFSKYCLNKRVTLVINDAEDELIKLIKLNKKFDLIFLDGAKGQYIKYYQSLKSLLNPSGILFADNIYLHGLVNSDQPIKHKHRTMVNNLRKFISQLESDNSFETNFYDIDDGFSISILKN